METKKYRIIGKGLIHPSPTSKPSLAYLYKQSETSSPLSAWPSVSRPNLSVHTSPRTSQGLSAPWSLGGSPSLSPPPLSHLHGFAFTAHSTHQSPGFPQALSQIPCYPGIKPFLILPANINLSIFQQAFGLPSTLAHGTIHFLSVICSLDYLPRKIMVFKTPSRATGIDDPRQIRQHYSLGQGLAKVFSEGPHNKCSGFGGPQGLYRNYSTARHSVQKLP